MPRNDSNTEMLAAALRYARRGWPVLPVAPGDKMPLIRSAHEPGDKCRGECGRHGHGLYDATTDEPTIRNWWGEDGEPFANIGLRTGSAEGGGCGAWALDVDDKPGAMDAILELCAANGDPECAALLTRRAATGGGGAHHLYRFGSDLATWLRENGRTLGCRSAIHGVKGLDLRGDGSYVVVAPSVHPSGGVYRWEDEREPIDAPEWLLLYVSKLLDVPRGPPPVPVAPLPGDSRERRYGKAVLRGVCDRIAEAGRAGEGRRRAIFSAAILTGGFVTIGAIDEAEAEATLLQAGRATGTGNDVAKAVRDGLAYGKARPLVVPERELTPIEEFAVELFGEVPAKGDRRWKELGWKFNHRHDEPAPPHEDEDAPWALTSRWVDEPEGEVVDAGADQSEGQPQADGRAPGTDTNGEARQRDGAAWPAPLGASAMIGLAGEFVRIVEPHTEADSSALLVQFLAAAGDWIGRGPYLQVGGDRHHANLNAALVGQTAAGRKGTSWGEVRRVFRLVDPDWFGACVKGGLSSGEGVIHAVRDELITQEAIREGGKKTGAVIGYQPVVADPGVEDKRLLIVETEFASVLTRMLREGNALSAIIRQAWDTGDIAVMTRTPYKATGAHIAIVTHITRDELNRLLTATEMANGFANRFLWVCVRRSKLLPEGGTLDERDLTDFALRVVRAGEAARKRGRLRRTPEATALWGKEYARLTREHPGMLGVLVGRAAPLVLRLALIYALLDGQGEIDVPHLRAALEVWRYCEDSVRYVFGEALGDPTADRLLGILRRAGATGLSRTDIRDALGRNAKESEVDRALGVLADAGLARFCRQRTGGRPAERWTATTT